LARSSREGKHPARITRRASLVRGRCEPGTARAPTKYRRYGGSAKMRPVVWGWKNGMLECWNTRQHCSIPFFHYSISDNVFVEQPARRGAATGGGWSSGAVQNELEAVVVQPDEEKNWE